ncbi:hypothetical protein A3759_18250 [Thalassolituus sp. HI0120]|nr:hypothetical protein A3759_18250 [Thalassolituus sp. HI0120]
MKFLQKATLAAAIAAVPFAAQAELKAMDDAMMSATTGQAGVTIDMNLAAGTGYEDNDATTNDAAIQIGKITYKDGGGVAINNIAIGSTNANTLKQVIDVQDNGQLEIVMTTTEALNVRVGSVHLQNNGDTVVGESLASDVNLNVSLGTTTTKIGANSTYDAADRIAYSTATGVSADTLVIDSTTSVELTSSSMNALGGKVGLTGITFNDGGAGNKATVKQKIWATSSIADADPGTPGNQPYQGGVNIQLSEIKGDLAIGGIVLGGTSIGSVTVSDIVMAGVTQKIYGH